MYAVLLLQQHDESNVIIHRETYPKAHHFPRMQEDLLEFSESASRYKKTDHHRSRPALHLYPSVVSEKRTSGNKDDAV